MLGVVAFYQNADSPLRYSKFLLLSKKERGIVWTKIKKAENFLVEIVAYCLMPNHFHLLLKQLKNDGIKQFISNITNSYTKYFNTKRKRSGPIFQGRFKAVRIETGEQLLHVSRYIHLNPYSSYLIRQINELLNYPYSSLPEYLQKGGEKICNQDFILNNFKTKKDYKRFVFNNADYQRKLQDIKHLLLET